MNIRDMMTADVVTVAPETGVREALRLLSDRGLDSLVVSPVAGGPGIATLRDLEAADAARRSDADSCTVASVTSAPVPQVHPDLPLARARDLLARHACSHLLVMDGDRVVGVISAETISTGLDLLGDHRIFAGLDHAAMNLLLRVTTFRDVPAGTVLLQEGAEDADLFVLDRGCLTVHTRQAGRIAQIRPGEMIGELEIFGGPNAATVRAAEDCRVLVIERARLLVLMAGNPSMAAAIYTNISELLGERLKRANRFLFLRGIARHRMLVLTVLAAIGVGFMLFTVGFGVVSESPRFCITCHYMQPYYESWALSTHREVRCAECHYSYGFRGVMRGKVTGLAMVTRYLTRTYDPKPEAEVSDTSCMQAGCHAQSSRIQAMVSAPEIRFPHPTHCDSLDIGVRLRCTSCHQHGRQRVHFSVAPNLCYLCHFMNQTSAQMADGCRVCHTFSRDDDTPMQIDHSALPERISCVYCHDPVVQGDGMVDEYRCYSCHLDPETSIPTRELHQIHIRDRDVACFECHAEIKHQGGTGPILAQNCLSCHPEQHAAQEQLYLGQGGRDVLATPGIMSYFHVECTGCHRPAGDGVTPRLPDSAAHQVSTDADEACLSCHELDHRDTLRMWQTTIDSTMVVTHRALRRVEQVLDGATADDDPSRVRARELYDDAAFNYALVSADNSRGVHNFKYARELLLTAQRKLARALDLLGG